MRQNREFLRIEPENATAMLKALGGREIDNTYIDISIDELGSVISTVLYDNRLPVRSTTTFDMLDISVGSKLYFTRNDNIVCEVYDNRKVKYQDNIYSLS